MLLAKNWKIAYNPFFLFPFLAWVVVGAFLLIFYSRRDLFYTPNTHYSDLANMLLYYFTILGQGEVIIPVLLLLLLFRMFRNWYYIIQALLCNLVPFFIQQILKSVFNHPRPRLLFYNRLWMHYLSNWPVYLERSFPSGHSTGAFSFFCFLSLLLMVKYKPWGLLFFLLAMLVCYSRI